MLFAWVAFCIFAGLFLGYLGKTITDQLSASLQFTEILARLGGNAMPADSFYTMVLMIIGEVATVYAIMAVLKMQSEETDMHAEALLATSVSRLRWAAGHLAIAMVGTAVVLMTFGLCTGLTYGLSMGNVGHELPRMLFAILAYLPAIWVVAGIAVALFGLLPRLTILAWGALVVCLLVDLMKEFQLARGAILAISPFTEVPKLLITDGSIVPLIGLAVIVVVLVVAGLIGLQRRSIG
jgi:ABC-2 type transport system permease protein